MSVDSAGSCSICGLNASGHHFGTLSCQACNAFFRRSIADDRRYLCHRSGRCTVAQLGKWYCRACRLKKCLEQGMDPKAVQLHRDVIGQKRKNTEDDQENNAKSSQSRHRKLSASSQGDIGRRSASHKCAKKNKGTKNHGVNRRFIVERIIAKTKRATGKVSSDSGRTGRSSESTLSKPATRHNKATPSTSTGNVSVMLKESDSSLRSKNPNSQSRMEQLEDNRNLRRKKLSSSSGSQPSTSTCVTHKPVYDASKNKIEILRRAYSRLVELRRLMFNRGSLRDILDDNELPPYRGKVGLMSMHANMDVRLIVDFLNNFDAFSKLRTDDRVHLMKNGTAKFFTLERHYITMCRGGLITRRITNFDGSYYDVALVGKEASETTSKPETTDEQRISARGNKKVEQPVQDLDADTMRRVFVPAFNETLKNLSGAMYRSGTTDVEFLALVFLLFLDHRAANLSSLGRRVLKEARDDLFRDWYAYYEAHNIPDGVLKMGNSISMLSEVHIATEICYENFYISHLFDLFYLPPVVKEILER